MSDTQAMAARLTAIAELKDEIDVRVMCALQSGHGVANVELLQRAALALADLSAHVETLTQQVAELEANFDARDDGMKAALEGRPRTDNPHWAGDSFGVPTIWQMWDEGYDCCINRALKAENARLTAEAKEDLRVMVEEGEQLRQAEQQRDAAHAALKQIAESDSDRYCRSDEDDTLTTDGIEIARAYFNPAPAQETERGR